MAQQLRLNPAIDVEAHARAYAAQKAVQIPNLFEPDIADQIEHILASLPWRLVCQNDAEENVLLTREQLAAMSPEELKRLDEGQRERAARGIGYTYFMYPMISAALQNWDREHPIHVLTQFLNSPPFFDFARKVTSHPGITKVDAHASLYRQAHYLTTHQDNNITTHGRSAYTIGFSRDWQADWGGLLMFLDDKGDVTRGFVPRFNTLTIFDGRVPHTVTSVSLFTPKPRLSIAGWFRDDPVPPRGV